LNGRDDGVVRSEAYAAAARSMAAWTTIAGSDDAVHQVSITQCCNRYNIRTHQNCSIGGESVCGAAAEEHPAPGTYCCLPTPLLLLLIIIVIIALLQTLASSA